jgi:hypothetical protein
VKENIVGSESKEPLLWMFLEVAKNDHSVRARKGKF